jgi:mono/diheme cytochrome c family protein
VNTQAKTVEISSICRGAALTLLGLLVGAGNGHSQTGAAALFSTRCTGCHTFGKGDKVGPDLKGVTARRDRSWLLDWIRSPAAMIRSGDPTAVALNRKYRAQRMPDFDLPVEQVAALVDYLASGGPAADAGEKVRDAASATAEEVRRGEQLFLGRVALASGAAACISCHAVAGRGAVGGTLGPDLTKAYAKYRDRGLYQYLLRTSLPRGPLTTMGGKRALTPDESLALRAFLRSSDRDHAAVALNREPITGSHP